MMCVLLYCIEYICWLMYRKLGYLGGWLVGWLFGWLVGWLAGWLFGCLGRSVGCLGWLGWLFG
jgi:hypothetical protein